MLNPAKITSTVGLNSEFLLVLLPGYRCLRSINCSVGKVEVDQARLNFWDVGGQEDLRCLWANYLDEVSFVISSSE